MPPDWKQLAGLTSDDLQTALLAEAGAVMTGQPGPERDRDPPARRGAGAVEDRRVVTWVHVSRDDRKARVAGGQAVQKRRHPPLVTQYRDQVVAKASGQAPGEQDREPARQRYHPGPALQHPQPQVQRNDEHPVEQRPPAGNPLRAHHLAI
jgi:hypothetical protein